MNVGSLFTGIGGFDLGLERAGHRIVFQCEKDPHRRRVLARRWPGVPCFEDVHAVASDQAIRSGVSDLGGSAHARQRGRAAQRDTDVDLLCGGFPCQDLSVAGKRAGLDGERSGLFFEFARIADALLSDGGWVLIENVPGLLSSHGGRDFAVLLSTLAELGFHDLAWRVLDSRYLGVPQRRRRVFILARRSRGRCASEVLLEPESGGGDFEASRASREVAAQSVGESFANPLGAGQAGGARGQRLDLDHDTYVARSLTAETGQRNNGTEQNFVVGEKAHPDRVRAPSGVPGRVDSSVTHALTTSKTGGAVTEDGTGRGAPLTASGGEPSDLCAIDPKPDGPRYAACGDAVTVQAAEWIGRRLTQ